MSVRRVVPAAFDGNAPPASFIVFAVLSLEPATRDLDTVHAMIETLGIWQHGVLR